MLKLIRVAKKTILRYPVKQKESGSGNVPGNVPGTSGSGRFSTPKPLLLISSTYIMHYSLLYVFKIPEKFKKKTKKYWGRKRKPRLVRRGFCKFRCFFSEREIVDRFGDITCRLYAGSGACLGLGSIPAFGSAGVTAAAFGASAA